MIPQEPKILLLPAVQIPINNINLICLFIVQEKVFIRLQTFALFGLSLTQMRLSCSIAEPCKDLLMLISG